MAEQWTLRRVVLLMVGVVFAALMIGLGVRGNVSPVMIGVAYALGIWALMRYAILPLNDGEETLFTTDLVTPQWVWWLSHAALGMTAGIYYDAVRRLLAGRERVRPEQIPHAA